MEPRPRGRLVGDGRWLEVMRIAAPYGVPWSQSSQATKRSENRLEQAETREPREMDRAPGLGWPGCWFWVAHGSGIFLNVGRSLRAPSRVAVARSLGLLSESNMSASAAARTQQFWCSRARMHGFDTIQVASQVQPAARQGRSGRQAEVLVCSEECTPQHLLCGACAPGVTLRSGVGASRECVCDERLPLLNCGRPLATSFTKWCIGNKRPASSLEQIFNSSPMLRSRTRRCAHRATPSSAERRLMERERRLTATRTIKVPQCCDFYQRQISLGAWTSTSSEQLPLPVSKRGTRDGSESIATPLQRRFQSSGRAGGAKHSKFGEGVAGGEENPPLLPSAVVKLLDSLHQDTESTN